MTDRRYDLHDKIAEWTSETSAPPEHDDFIEALEKELPKLLAVIDLYEMAMEQVEDCCPNNGEIAAICAETLKRVGELAGE